MLLLWFLLLLKIHKVRYFVGIKIYQQKVLHNKIRSLVAFLLLIPVFPVQSSYLLSTRCSISFLQRKFALVTSDNIVHIVIKVLSFSISSSVFLSAVRPANKGPIDINCLA